MTFLLSDPLEKTWQRVWGRVDRVHKKAFLIVVGISLLAFGFEMTNLTLHHDDVVHIFIEDTILGHYVGRFGFGWLHYYGQSAHLMPFLQVVEGVVLMTIYGMVVSIFWGARKTLDVVLISAIVCVFPYMAQGFQYNSSIAPFSMAHLLAALAVTLSTRGSLLCVAVAAFLYMAAFSIYQSVIANAATIFCVWVLSRILYPVDEGTVFSAKIVKSVIAAAIAVGVGGALYLAAVSTMDLEFDSYQAADQAFRMKGIFDLSYALEQVIQGSQAFYRWPQHYFPGYLKNVQLGLFFAAAVVCVRLPRGVIGKFVAVLMLGVTLFAPRILQVLHPHGTYHELTLTAYAVVIAGFVMIINRAGFVLLRNVSSLFALFLIAGYIVQSNWISTVNYLNMLAHYTTLTQILARVRSIPEADWDGKTIVVVGRHAMYKEYPFKKATGIATEYMDAEHMQHLSRLMREDISIVEADNTTPEVLAYAAQRPAWPHSTSVGIVNGVGVVIFSKTQPMPH